MIQEKLFKEISNIDIFKLANTYGVQYLQNIFNKRVYPEQSAIDRLAVFDEALPDGFTSSIEILIKLKDFGEPAAVAQNGGRYFGFVVGGTIPAGLAARLYTDFWDQNSAMQVMSPIATKLETVVEKWLIDIFHLPLRTAAGFVNGTTMATFCGLAAARFRLLKRKEWDINQEGLFGAPAIRIIAGRQIHASALRAMQLLGFGMNNIEWVDCDKEGKIIPEAFPQLDNNTIVMLQAGNVNTGSFDDFKTICSKANKAGAWVHIDGAFGMWAAACDQLDYLTEGLNQADSWSLDCHKTLNTPYDNGVVLCKDAEALVASFNQSGSYFVTSNDRDGMYYTPEMSRRARIFELWAAMRSIGRKGISEMVHGMHRNAVKFAEGLSLEGFTILNEISFNQVLVFYKNNETTMNILKDVQEQGVCWCGGSKWEEKDVIRISVSSWATTEEDIRISIDSFVKARNKAE
jgi:glutamate/tyrosine decarboxylase-like PLP-dependent enzyme